MCLVFIGFRIPGCPPVLVGANREEARSRPMTSPVCCRVGPGSRRCLLAGADHGPDGSFLRMGTWLGVNDAGMAVAVTNRSDGELAWVDQTRSKGLLAVDLLGFERPDDAIHFAGDDLASGGFGGCNVLVAGLKAGFVVEAPGARRIRVVELTSGIHAMTNLDLNDPDDPRIRLVQELFDPHDFPASAARLCRDERIVRIGTDRGTISSSLLAIGPEVAFDHIRGDPRGREYDRYRFPDSEDPPR
jgi:uncharacterized protein with NRDE domain